MYIDVEAGCQEVPDAIWPIHITFFSLAPPTVTPISLPDMTNGDAAFDAPGSIPGMPSLPFVPAPAPEGLAPGIGIFIFCSPADCELGEAEGICMPGVFICVCGDDEGEGCGICMPGVFTCVCGDDEGVACGICMPGMFIGFDCGAADFLGGEDG
jgi:hypothetical protein